eukprot:scaffold28258_cov79-Isochrysis_galbana.AAC.1
MPPPPPSLFKGGSISGDCPPRLFLAVIAFELQKVEHVRMPRLQVHREGAAPLAAALRRGWGGGGEGHTSEV